MSDFLVHFTKQESGPQLLDALKSIQGSQSSSGHVRRFSWGTVAILNERYARNVLADDQGLCGWVGDLVHADPMGLLGRMREAMRCRVSGAAPNSTLAEESVFSELNGAFALLFADNTGLWIVTDPMNFVQVYETRGQGALLGIGTHADSVTRVCGQTSRLDLGSVAEFLNAGTPSFPHTMYEATKELAPGSAYRIGAESPHEIAKACCYWSPPAELTSGTTFEEQAEVLRHALTAAVRDRSRPDRMGLFLSGGLDSRVVLNLVPRESDCLALTFSNAANRETRIAGLVAQSLGRQWKLLLRSPEALAECLPAAVRLLGCEYEWVHAQIIAMRSQLEPLGLQSILLGTQFNVYLKGYWAADWRRRKRGGGLLKPSFEPRPVDYMDVVKPEWRGGFRSDVQEELLSRRRKLVETRRKDGRSSLSEWLEVYPFTQERGNGFWLAERRFLPTRYVGMDRRLLDFAFRCPVVYKLGDRVFNAAVASLYGPSASIPAAADGVRPLSGRVSRLAQRAGRKAQKGWNSILSNTGLRKEVQHSWHDYEGYWKGSPQIASLARKYATALSDVEMPVLTTGMADLLKSPSLTWRQGFRLLQLGAWRANQ